jgi:catechol 2,3-dioxygenase-like lactoylglutathione lyase family enzyme
VIQIAKIGHATFETPDVERMTDYYVEVLGLAVVDKSASVVTLACPSDRQSVVLRHGSAARCVKLSLETGEARSGVEIAKTLGASGVSAWIKTDAEPAGGEVVSLEGPDGGEIDILPPRPPAGVRPERGVIPRKLGHVAFKTLDVEKAADFYVTVLGFRVSDWMGDFFAFLRCGPDHHTVNLLRGPQSKMHHIAFEADNWDHIRRACDFLAGRKMPVIWGPGRHGIGHNIFIYHRNPDGQIVELYTELDQMSVEALGYFDPRPWHGENPQRPKVWDPALPSNVWGPPLPEGFRD